MYMRVVKLVEVLIILPVPFLLYVVWKKRLHRTLPWFAAYLVFQVIALPLEVGPWLQQDLWGVYYYTLWATALGGYAISLIVLLQIARMTISRMVWLRQQAREWTLFVGALIVLSVLAITIGTPPQTIPVWEVLMTVYRGSQLLQTGIAVGLLAFCAYYGFLWSSSLFGIVLGFALQGTISFYEATYAAAFGLSVGGGGYMVMHAALGLVILISRCMWLIYILRDDAVPQTSFDAEEHMRSLNAWSKVLIAHFANESDAT
jgi:hypothetical protein